MVAAVTDIVTDGEEDDDYQAHGRKRGLQQSISNSKFKRGHTMTVIMAQMWVGIQGAAVPRKKEQATNFGRRCPNPHRSFFPFFSSSRDSFHREPPSRPSQAQAERRHRGGGLSQRPGVTDDSGFQT